MQQDKLEVEEGDLTIVLVRDLLLDLDRVLAWDMVVARMEELRLLGEKREKGKNTMSQNQRKFEILLNLCHSFPLLFLSLLFLKKNQ
jgi:hypothetical protein